MAKTLPLPRVFPLPPWLRHCLCLVCIPLLSWLRHCRYLMYSTAFVAKALPLPCVSTAFVWIHMIQQLSICATTGHFHREPPVLPPLPSRRGAKLCMEAATADQHDDDSGDGSNCAFWDMCDGDGDKHEEDGQIFAWWEILHTMLSFRILRPKQSCKGCHRHCPVHSFPPGPASPRSSRRRFRRPTPSKADSETGSSGGRAAVSPPTVELLTAQ